MGSIAALEEVSQHAYCLEEKALIRFSGRDYVATIKGVDSTFHRVNDIEKTLIDGVYFNQSPLPNAIVLGKGVSYYLSLGLSGIPQQATIMIPKEGRYLNNPDQAFYQEIVSPSGIFSIQADFDSEYVIAPIALIRNMLGRGEVYSSIEFRLNSYDKEALVKEKLTAILGESFIIKNREEQHSFLNKIMKTERLAALSIFCFILLIAAFNMIGSLTMLMLEKKEHIKTLWNIGMTQKSLTRLFIYEGLLIGAVGCFIGLTLGLGLSLGQEHFGWLKLGAEGSFIVSSYPVKVAFSDILLTVAIVSILVFLSSWIPAKRLSKKFTSYIS